MPNRKTDHLNLAKESQSTEIENDKRFYYEPFLAAHPDK